MERRSVEFDRGFYSDPFAQPHQSFSVDSAGTWGLTVGYNKQFGSMVAGLEADISWSNLSGDLRAVSVQQSQWDIEAKLETWGTVRGRLGFLATPNVLVFGTAGFAAGQVEAKQATNFLAPPDVGGRTSGTVNHIGYTVGAGFEWALTDNISFKGEYLYVDLGKENYQLTGTTKPNGSVPYVETFATDLQFQVVRAGLNWRF